MKLNQILQFALISSFSALALFLTSCDSGSNSTGNTGGSGNDTTGAAGDDTTGAAGNDTTGAAGNDTPGGDDGDNDTQASEPIVGTWRSDDGGTNDGVYLIFFADGTYAQAQKVERAGVGLEQGTYQFDESTGILTVNSVTFDQNGESGLSEDPGINSSDGDGMVNVSGNTLTITSDEDDNGSAESTFTLTRVDQTSGLQGTWTHNENGFLALVFNPDGTYIHLENDPNESEQGIEYGTYTFANNKVMPTVTLDLNGSIGLTDSQGIGFDVNLSNSTFFFIEEGDTDTIQFTRP